MIKQLSTWLVPLTTTTSPMTKVLQQFEDKQKEQQ